MVDIIIPSFSREIRNLSRNPKLEGSNIIDAVPQTGECPGECFPKGECFYNGLGWFRSKDTPLLPTLEEVGDKIVRVNSGHDSNFQKQLVLDSTKQYKEKFYNTSIPHFDFPGPVVFTCNSQGVTSAIMTEDVGNLMMVRFRANPWNMDMLKSVVEYYVDDKNVPVTITFMRYRNMNNIPISNWEKYEVRVHILNKWAVLKKKYQEEIMDWYREYDNMVGLCGTYESSLCRDCGRCEWAYNKIVSKKQWKNAMKSLGVKV